MAFPAAVSATDSPLNTALGLPNSSTLPMLSQRPVPLSIAPYPAAMWLMALYFNGLLKAA